MEKNKLQPVLAIDFDGCLCENAWPEVGAPLWPVIEAAKRRRREGWVLILWTCREGDALAAAVAACSGWGLHFDAVNASLPAWVEAFGSDSRKVGATEYWDDKAVRVPACVLVLDDWHWPTQRELYEVFVGGAAHGLDG